MDHIDLNDLKMLVDLDGDGHFDAQDLKELWKRLHIMVKYSIKESVISCSHFFIRIPPHQTRSQK